MSQSMQIFDPIGFLNGWIVNAKLIIQKLWQRKFDWDDEVPEDILQALRMDTMEERAEIC